MQNLEYIKKLEDLKQKNNTKVENLKLVNKKITTNIDTIESEITLLKIEIDTIKKLECEIRHLFFELCVTLKI